MDTEDRQHLETLLQRHHNNLRYLEKKAAEYGSLNVPTSLYNEMEIEKSEILKIKAQLSESKNISLSIVKRKRILFISFSVIFLILTILTIIYFNRIISRKQIPIIQNVTLREEYNEKGVIIVQQIRFQDMDGDASFIDYTIVSSTNYDVVANPGKITTLPQQQKNGALIEAGWMCTGKQYSVTLRAVIQDQKGNKSEPYEYTINCH
jgi:hypothetical protein